MVNPEGDAVIIKMVCTLIDSFNYMEDQLKMECDPKTARFGPMSSDERVSLEQFNKGYKRCLQDMIRCIPFLLGQQLKKEFKELYDENV